jgi:RNA polymerase sigma factor (sigma-70 family)
VTNDTATPDDDIVHDAIATAYEQVEGGRYEPRLDIPFTAYVKGIARNKIREARRRGRRFIPLDDTEYIDGDTGVRLETVVERREQRDSLRTGLSKLPTGRRLVLEGYLQGHTTAEIATALDMTEESVRQHKCRGLRSLRQMDVLAAN